MKKIVLCTAILIFIGSSVFAVDFSPTLLRLSAPDIIQYNFDGSGLEIPVTQSGTPGTLVFLVYTKDKADQIENVHNGYLGWHFVNNVDTCIYVSDAKLFDTGKNTVTWDGNDADGNMVPPGEYTYYMWAFDSVSKKIKATSAALQPVGNNPYGILEEKDENGLPASNPMIHRIAFNGDGVRWTLGGDPEDLLLTETSHTTLPADYSTGMRSALDPSDFNTVYMEFVEKTSKYVSYWKYTWVPNGETIVDDKWGEDLKFLSGAHKGKSTPGLVADANYLFSAVSFDYEFFPMCPFYVIDYDGTLIEEIDMTRWMSNPDEYARGGKNMNYRVQHLDMRQGKIFMGAQASCIKILLDPYAYLESGESDDFWYWINGNGDYLCDINFEEDATFPWGCAYYDGPPYMYSNYLDANLFTAVAIYDFGAVSFCLLGPDGTGIDNFSYAGDTASVKNANMFCDNGSAFDGIYCDNRTAPTSSETTEESEFGYWFIGHDSIKGIITSKPVAVDDAPTAFAVAQNSPNPFNPSTTINFTIPEAGNTSIDIFNVAGQKVDTIVNDFNEAGVHSTTWDASGFSAGVYFYTVKSGDFSKTMKMTLLK